MVAEATLNSTSKRKVKGRGHAPEIDLLTRSKARNLYAIRRLGAQEVANQTGLTVPQVYSLAQREGWTELRTKMRSKERELILARAEKDIEATVEAHSSKAQVLSLSIMDKALEEVEKDGPFVPKNLAALSMAAKNFVGLYRQANMLDARQAESAGSQGHTLNVMFVGSLPPAQRITKNITPVQQQSSSATLDVQAAQHAQSSTAQQ